MFYKSWLKLYFGHYRGFNQAVWLNTLGTFVNSFGFLPGAFLALYLVDTKDISVQMAAVFLSVGSVGGIIGAYLSGYLADRYSPVTLAQLSLFLFAFFVAMIPFMNGTWSILSMLFVVYLLYGAFKPLNSIILMAHSSVIDRPRVMGVSRMALNLGLSFSMVIGGALAAHTFAWYFYFCALTTLTTTFLFVRFQKPMELPPDWRPPVEPGSKKFSTWQIFRNRPFMLLAIVYLGYCLVYYQVRMTFGLYMTSTYGLSVATFGMLFALNMVMVVLLEVPLMNLLKDYNQIKVCIAGIILIAIGLGMLPFGTGIYFAIASTMLWSLGEILTSSPFYAIVMQLAHPQARGTYLGFFQSLMSAGSILSQLVGGFLFPIYHSKILWFGCFFVSLALIGGLIYLQAFLDKKLQDAT